MPEPAEEEERDDEHDRRAPVEEPRGDREILDLPDPVRDEVDQGRTSSTASSASGWWSSTSKRPGSFAVSGMRTGLPGGSASRRRSRARGPRRPRSERTTSTTFSPCSSVGRLIPPRGRPWSTTITIVRVCGLGLGFGAGFAGVVCAGAVVSTVVVGSPEGPALDVESSPHPASRTTARRKHGRSGRSSHGARMVPVRGQRTVTETRCTALFS